MKNSDSTQQKEEINIQVFDDHTRSKLIRDSNFCNKSAIYTRIFHCPGIKTIFDVQLYMAKEKNTEICHTIIPTQFDMYRTKSVQCFISL